MVSAPSPGPLERLINALLPNGGALVTMFHAYFDESYTNDKAVFCVGGYLVHADRAIVMERQWLALLKEYDVPYFHMVDCAHGNEHFERLNAIERRVLVSKLIDLIKRYTYAGFAAVVKSRRCPILHADEANPYYVCLELAFTAMATGLLNASIPDQKVALFAEADCNDMRFAIRNLHNLADLQGYSSHTFAKKSELCLLQAADLLAWQLNRDIRGRFLENRPRRKDFASLLQHSHLFCYTGIHDDKATLRLDVNPAVLDNESLNNYLKAIFSKGPESDSHIEYENIRLSQADTPVMRLLRTVNAPLEEKDG